MTPIKNLQRPWVASLGFCAALVSPGLAAEPTITLTAPLSPLFDFKWNQNHGNMTSCGFKHVSQSVSGCGPVHSYGAWADGPLNPYRYGGHTYFQIPHSEHFRIKIPGHNWGDRYSWQMEGAFAQGAPVMPAQRSQVESHYNNRNWLFAVRSENNTLYGLTHHEWYKNSITINGISGFIKSNTPWIASIGWMSSSNGGASWFMRPTSEGSRRMVVVPEPSSSAWSKRTFGFMHPSNIVKEGNYYYTFTSAVNVRRSDGYIWNGVSLFRTLDISRPTGWEYWGGTKWVAVNHNTYQGNFGSQRPYVFWGANNDCTGLYAMNVRRHKNGKWITLGSKYCLPAPPAGQGYRYQAVFAWTNSLANPASLEGNLREVKQNGMSLLSNNYYSFFDVSGAADDNYQNIGDNPLLVVTVNWNTYYHQFLKLTGF